MFRLKLIEVCSSEFWQLRLGDPGWIGLTLTVLYVLTSLAFLYTIVTAKDWLRNERLLWGACAAIVILLTINKQLDLQHFAGMVGRCVSVAEGWYDQHAAFQRRSAMVVLGIGAVLAVATAWACRLSLLANWRLLSGMVLLLLYVSLQVVRFEHLGNSALLQSFAALRLHRVIEATALLVLLYAAWHRVRPGKLPALSQNPT